MSQLDKIVIVVAVLVAASVLIPITWLSSLKWTPHATSPFSITDVQFEENYLNITVKSTCTEAKIISQVTVRYLIIERFGFSTNRTSTPHVVAVHEPVLMGEEISFRISFKWSSGCAYQVELETEDKDWGNAINVIAP